MGNVMVIPAKRQVGNNIKKAEKPKLRIAAYCRVSTDSDEQATSYEAQIEHYTECISKNPEWVMAGIFADDGITGTNTKKRDEFNHMIEECHTGNIDMIITKSISRFARNTLDRRKYIRELKDLPEHSGFLRKRVHQHNGLQRRGAFDHHGLPCPAGKPELIAKREARHSVPLPARQGAGQPQPLSRLHQRR